MQCIYNNIKQQLQQIMTQYYKNAAIALWMMILSVMVSCAGNKINLKEAYHLKRGIELFEQNENDAAMECLKKELKEHEKNGYAYFWIGKIHYINNDYGLAMEDANQAIKYIEKDNDTMSEVYLLRARVYRKLDDEGRALHDYAQSIQLRPKFVDTYMERGFYLAELGKYDQSDLDYQKMNELRPGSPAGYIGLGQNEILRDNPQKALEYFDYAKKLKPENEIPYAYLAEAKAALKRYDEAAVDVVKAMSIEYSVEVDGDMMNDLFKYAYPAFTAQMKMQFNKAPNEDFWPMMIAIASEKSKHYEEAIRWLETAQDIRESSFYCQHLSATYRKVGDWSKSYYWINRATELNPDDEEIASELISFEDNIGMTELAWKHVHDYIDKHPDHYWGYYRKGWLFNKNDGQLDSALVYYTKAIDLTPRNAYNYLSRGQVYRLQGRRKQATEDFSEAVRLDSTCTQSNAAMFSYLYLGDTIRCLALCDSMLLTADRNAECYDAACVYAMIDSLDKAVSLLRESFEAGEGMAFHARRDQDMDKLRGYEPFELLLSEYEKKQGVIDLSMLAKDVEEYTEECVEIPMQKDGTLYSVKCEVNGLPLHFLFDTGASSVTISTVEATFMLKNDYLKSSDLSGKQYYMTASGQIAEGTSVVLKTVNFGGIVLHDIKAMVVKSQRAPLLLGQAVLQRLGRIDIDNTRNLLKVYQRK